MHKINQIKGNIQTAIIHHTLGKGNRNKNDWNIHASEIINFCSRRYKLHKRHNIPFHEDNINMTIGLAMTFQIGLATEEFFVRSMGANSNLTTLFAYRCSKCGKIYLKTDDKTKFCHYCNYPLTKEQITLKYKILDDASIIGHPDLVMRLNSLQRKFHVYELKTIKPEEFDILQSPLINHVYQVRTYLWLIKNLPNEKRNRFKLDYETGYIVYIKKTYDKDPMKIFEIKLTEDFEENMERIINQLQGKERTERICNSKYSIIAKKCPVAKYCWEER